METAQPVQATCLTAWQFLQEQPFLKSSQNTSCCSLHQVFPFPPTMHHCEMPVSTWRPPRCGVGRTSVKSAWSHLFSRLNIPSSPIFSQDKCPGPWLASWSSTELTAVHQHLLPMGGPKLDAASGCSAEKRQITSSFNLLAVLLLTQPRRLTVVPAARAHAWSMPTCPPGPQAVPSCVIHHTNRNQEHFSHVDRWNNSTWGHLSCNSLVSLTDA